MQSLVILLVSISNLLTFICAQQCANAPSLATRMHCDQLQWWDSASRATAPLVQTNAVQPEFSDNIPVAAPSLATVAATAYDCMDIGCLCSYFGGQSQGGNTCTLGNGQPLQMAIRPEYRMLSDSQRNRYHAAINTLKRSGVFDQIATIHSNVTIAGSAHGAPSFLPWHREFIKRYEIALRQIDPSITVPYWDSTLESHLPNPADSALFTSQFIGATDGAGNVADGPFGGWITNQGRRLARSVGRFGASPFIDSDIAYVMRQTRIEAILAYTTPQQGCPFPADFNVLEYSHGDVHMWVGGDMSFLLTSANDPIFYMHHAFVDNVWELWRQARQSRIQRERAYPPDNVNCESPKGFARAPMSPFDPKVNIDGCSNQYTDNLFRYAPRPSCALGPNCGSNYLYCVRSRGVCVPKIRIGGNCRGFNTNDDVCLNGMCWGGTCVSTSRADEPLEPDEPQYLPIPRTKEGRSVLRPIQISCFNEHQCCSHWSSVGECTRNPGYMTTWCKPSCELCEPNYDNVTDCADRHHKCREWAAFGECTRNRLWMEENCRLTCTNCYAPRAAVCGSDRSQQWEGTAAEAPALAQFFRSDVDEETDAEADTIDEGPFVEAEQNSD